VEQNPYQSPEIPNGRIASSFVGAVSVIIAVSCWLAGLAYIGEFIRFMLSREAQRFSNEPLLFIVTTVCGVLFPIAGLMTFGVASWTRSLRLAAIGAALMVPFMVLLAVRIYDFSFQ
jgi:hypothetical protein